MSKVNGLEVNRYFGFARETIKACGVKRFHPMGERKAKQVLGAIQEKGIQINDPDQFLDALSARGYYKSIRFLRLYLPQFTIGTKFSTEEAEILSEMNDEALYKALQALPIEKATQMFWRLFECDASRAVNFFGNINEIKTFNFVCSLILNHLKLPSYRKNAQITQQQFVSFLEAIAAAAENKKNGNASTDVIQQIMIKLDDIMFSSVITKLDINCLGIIITNACNPGPEKEHHRIFAEKIIMHLPKQSLQELDKIMHILDRQMGGYQDWRLDETSKRELRSSVKVSFPVRTVINGELQYGVIGSQIYFRSRKAQSKIIPNFITAHLTLIDLHEKTNAKLQGLPKNKFYKEAKITLSKAEDLIAQSTKIFNQIEKNDRDLRIILNARNLTRQLHRIIKDLSRIKSICDKLKNKRSASSEKPANVPMPSEIASAFETLGLSPEPPSKPLLAKIRSKFRKLAIKHHPDPCAHKNDETAEATALKQMKGYAYAYDLLQTWVNQAA